MQKIANRCCGCDPIIDRNLCGRWFCLCIRCGRSTNSYRTKHQAIKNWNKLFQREKSNIRRD